MIFSRRPWVAASLSVAVAAALVPMRRGWAQPATKPATMPMAAMAPDVKPIDFSEETLSNGLRVLYVPLKNAPVAQVRMMYHVGSRDERPDRQGFAHMFEHMMFRGSKHVPPQEHMKLVDQVGGICNAFTSFDQTVYHDTVPSEDLEMALYLEADRMASFKVTDEIYQIERKVVAQEWMLQQNRPNGNLFTDLMKTAYTTSSYQWTPIGNMRDLAAAPASDLQEFFNTYYVPNNAVLVVSGDIDVAEAKKLVHKFYEWIPAGDPVAKRSPDEPKQDHERDATTPDLHARLTTVVLGYHIPPYKSDDHYALSILSAVLGEGSSSRLDRQLVNNDAPLCIGAGTLDEQLEYGGLFGVEGAVLPGKDPAEVKKQLMAAVQDVIDHGVTADEVAKARTLRRAEAIHGRETCDEIAGQVGDELMWAGDAGRVNSDMAKLDAVTAADVQAVAAKYLQPTGVTALVVEPDPTGVRSKKAALMLGKQLTGDAKVTPSTHPVEPRAVTFPADYPEHPPLAAPRSKATFEKGQTATVNGIKVVVLTDGRLPTVSWTLAMRRGSHSDPAGKEGLGSMTAAMLKHGAGKMTFQQLSDEEDAHAISLGVSDGGDTTRLSGSCTTDELDRAFALSRDVLQSPTFPADEFAKLKAQAQAGLMQSLATPATAAERDMTAALYAGTPAGRQTTPASIAGITLDDVRKFYADFYHPNDAVLVVSGDVSFERGQALAKGLTDGWAAKDMPAVDYTPMTQPAGKRIILIDTADASGGASAIVRMGLPAYDIHTDEKFAGTAAGSILSDGIESRMMEYVRAKKGYVYGVGGAFQPGRYYGTFGVTAPTRPDVAADCIVACDKVLADLKNPAGENPLTESELADCKRRVTGSMVMGMQTIGAQGSRRLDGILNGYPADYYNNYPEHINQVTPEQVREVMDKYVKDDRMTIVVAAPAGRKNADTGLTVKEELEKLGPVEVRPMPLLRPGMGATTQPAEKEMMK